MSKYWGIAPTSLGLVLGLVLDLVIEPALDSNPVSY